MYYNFLGKKNGRRSPKKRSINKTKRNKMGFFMVYKFILTKKRTKNIYINNKKLLIMMIVFF